MANAGNWDNVLRSFNYVGQRNDIPKLSGVSFSRAFDVNTMFVVDKLCENLVVIRKEMQEAGHQFYLVRYDEGLLITETYDASEAVMLKLLEIHL